MRITSTLIVAGFYASLMLAAGCNSAPSKPPDVLPEHVHEHGDGHDHDHGHHHHHGHSHAAHGPNGGHLIEIGNEEYHGEWLHDDDSGKLTVYILDGDAKETVPISAESITIEKKIGDKVETYELVATDRSESNPKSAKFEIVDKPLVEALKIAGKGVEAILTVDIEGKKFQTKIEHHDHGHDHGHGHKH